MAWTTPRTWVTGEVVTATEMNAHVRDNLNALRQASLATGTVNSTGFAACTASTIAFDDLSGWVPTTSYWTAPYAGRFLIHIAGFWSSATGSGSMGVQLARYNSSGTLQENFARTDTTLLNGAASAAGVTVCASGDRIQFQAYNSSSGAAGSVLCRFSVTANG